MLGTLTNFSGIAALPASHPLRQQFEAGLANYWEKVSQSQGGVVMQSLGSTFSKDLATAEELRQMATDFCLEANKLELLPGRKTMFVIRHGQNLAYAEPDAEKVRFWCFRNPSDKHQMFEEVWATDEKGKPRCIARKPVSVKEEVS